MATLDLKPLTKEVIDKMGYSTHDLWVVKLNDEVFGPYEKQSLKHFASENENLFNDALASRLDTNDWQPFFSHAFFERKSPMETKTTHASDKGPYWILFQGQKTGPISKVEIEKKIETKDLSGNDLISYDDGHTWMKVYQVNVLNQKILSGDELPASPTEASFRKAKFEVTEKVEAHSADDSSGQDLATLVFLGQQKEKTLVLNLDEIDLKSLNETEVSRSLKWAIPVAMGVVFMFILTGYYLFSPPSVDTASFEEDKVKVKKQRPVVRVPPKAVPIPKNRSQRVTMPIKRRPASIQPTYPERSALTQPPVINESVYPTHVESHVNDRQPSNDPDPLMDPRLDPRNDPRLDPRNDPRLDPRNDPRNDPRFQDDRRQPSSEPQENSLVNSPERDSLDQSMNPNVDIDPYGIEEPSLPRIEEVTDF